MKCGNDFEENLSGVLTIIGNASALTHRHIRSQIACGIYCKIFADMWKYKNSKQLVNIIENAVHTACKCYIDMGTDDIQNELKHFDRLQDIERFKCLPNEKVESSGYVIDTLEAGPSHINWLLFRSKPSSNSIVLGSSKLSLWITMFVILSILKYIGVCFVVTFICNYSKRKIL